MPQSVGAGFCVVRLEINTPAVLCLTGCRYNASMSFFEREGMTPEKSIQINRIDDTLRNHLWNVVFEIFFKDGICPEYFNDSSSIERFGAFGSKLSSAWTDFFEKKRNLLPNRTSTHLQLYNDYIADGDWIQVYRFLEYLVALDAENSDLYQQRFNHYLDKEKSAYRFVKGKITPLTSIIEISEISTALEQPDSFYGAKEHLERALQHLSEKLDPDYRNSIKESISAVESVIKVLVPNSAKETLGETLKKLAIERKSHKGLWNGFSNIYGWTGAEAGIRHGIVDNESPTQADAKFMLVACSAFVNYLIASLATGE